MTLNRIRYADHSSRQSRSTKIPMVWTHREIASWHNPVQCTMWKIQKKRNKSKPRLCWIDNRSEDITLLGLSLKGAMDLTDDRWQWLSYICTHRRQMASINNWWWWLSYNTGVNYISEIRIERMPFYRIPHDDALIGGFKWSRNKERQKLHWMDNTNDIITLLELNASESTQMQ